MPFKGEGNAQCFGELSPLISLTLNMLSELKTHLENNLPFLRNKKLLVAVSGGIDSMVILHLLAQLNYDITIAHCNFNLRGKESDGDEGFVRDYAKKNKIKIFVTSFDTKSFASDNKLSIQVAARQLRYLWFNELLDDNGFDYLITAHHLDDTIETFLINFIRGTGIEGLTGIPLQNERITRPLLNFTRVQIETYAKRHDIAWREDSSNSSTKYLRNKLRHEIVPQLKDLNPAFADAFLQTIQNLKQTASLAHDAAIVIYQQVVAEKEGQKHIDVNQLLRLPNYKAYLYQWLNPFGFTAWEDIYALTEAQPGKQVLSAGYRILKDRDVLILEPIKSVDRKIYEISEGVTSVSEPLSIKLEFTTEISVESTKNVIFVNNNLINFPLFVRKWQEGDYFCPHGMKGLKKKVSKYFKDEKMSLSDKENTWILCSGNEIIWIIGRRADDRFKVRNTTDTILKIEVL
ncbi:tRNA lysidine(34) synthetase TilS [Flavobacterium sp. DG1-102-2]|uniref:tRNA lysidine(34) synthetase TilS n=1 Tax=Flavobacterium sp. DG1-102-2 TaxID=3081663 RepID=UPI00294A0CF6|nr:tRNA lysidine(34) synthetase TilS [Flavobacterium sp. DG1-102-2]MDV6167345.1 tRNA lysidine(34) synthetase TilS [Flavobacterium sp. DG1-102-2]